MYASSPLGLGKSSLLPVTEQSGDRAQPIAAKQGSARENNSGSYDL